MTQRDVTALKAFQEWFLSPAGPGLLRIPLYQPTHHESGVSAITLYRRNGYQAELCTLPQGQEYEIKIPEGSCALSTFLGGSLNYTIVNVPDSEKNIKDAALLEAFSTDNFIDDSTSDFQNPEKLEEAHPIVASTRHISYTQPLQEGHRVLVSSPQGNAIILFFSFYSTENDTISGLRFIQPMP